MALVVAGPKPVRVELADRALDVAAVQVAQRFAQAMDIVRLQVIVK